MDAEYTLPVKGQLTCIYASSLLIAILTAIVSITGLLSPGLFYPTEELLQTFLPNDVVGLFIGLPILFGSMWASKRGKLLGLLFWLGAVFFGFYNSIAYAFTFVNMALVSSVAIFFSTMVRNAVGPVIGTMAVIIFSLMISTIPLEIFRGIHPYMFTSYFSNWEQVFHDPIPWAELFRGANLVLSNILLFLGLAYIIFRRKDILS